MQQMSCLRFVNSLSQIQSILKKFHKDIAKGCYRLIVVSPELLLNDGHFKELWGKKKFTDNIINLVLDEAHVIKEWGGTFRSDYLKIGPIQYQFLRMIPMHLRSATVGLDTVSKLAKKPPFATRVHNCLLSQYRLTKHISYGTETANSYEDLAFLIKKNMQPGDPKPQKFLAFFNSRAEAQAGAEYLQS